MASKQRAKAPKKARNPNQLLDLGLFEIPDLNAMDDDESVDDDNDLESELEALLSGKSGSKPAQPRKKVIAPLDIEKIAAECLKDDISEDDDDESLNDPELLNELKGLTCEENEVEDILMHEKESSPEAECVSSQKSSVIGILPLLEERLKLYNEALSSAKAIGDASKARRFDRGIKTLEGLIKSAKSGKEINADDIPPVVSIPKERKAPIPTNTPKSVPLNIPNNVTSNDPVTNNLNDLIAEKREITKNKSDECIEILKNRRQKYKVAALEAKRAGDKVTALDYMKSLKKIDALIEGKNENIDMSMVPPSPPISPAAPQYTVSPPGVSAKEHGETQTSSIEAAALSAASEPEDPSLFAAPPPPTSILEALEQRLEKFASTLSAAKAEGNSSKARRLERIVKSYEKAIKDHKAGKSVDYEELPVPPGFAPIPVPSQSNASPAPSSHKVDNFNVKSTGADVLPPKRQAPEPPSSKSAPTQKIKVQKTGSLLGDKQLAFLLQRQQLFREAALSAKKSGNTPLAKEYLKMSKGFDAMCDAVKCGLPIDMSSIPTPPQLAIAEDDFVIVDRFECEEGSDSELFEILQKDLTKQIEMCKSNKEHFLKLGDVSSASKFETYYLESQKDLSIISHLQKLGQPPPKFHYETRMFSVVQCNTDLTDDQLEVRIERGINLPGKPDELDSYVKLEFPIPSDAPQKAKTNVVRDTNNPIFQEEFKFTFNRKSRTQLRQFKRQFLKLEVYSKGGFLRSDTCLGTVNIKLADLETKCTVHESFDLMDGRKMTGGKLECKVRIRQPLLTKQVEQVKEKWLIIGS